MEPQQPWGWDNQQGRFVPVSPAGQAERLLKPQQVGNRDGNQSQGVHINCGQRGGGHRGTIGGGNHGINEGNRSGHQKQAHLGQMMSPTGQTGIFPQQFSQDYQHGLQQGLGSSVTSSFILDQNEQVGKQMKKGSSKRSGHRRKKKQDGAIKSQIDDNLDGQNKRQGNDRRKGRGCGKKQGQGERRVSNTEGACGGERASEDGSESTSEDDENEEYSALKGTETICSIEQGTKDNTMHDKRNTNDVSTSNQTKDITRIDDIKDLGLTTLKNRMKRYKSKLAALRKEANKSANNIKALEKIALFESVIETIDGEIKSRLPNVDAQVPLKEHKEREQQSKPGRNSDNRNDDKTVVVPQPDTDDSASNSEDEKSLEQLLQQEGKSNRVVEVLLSKLKDLGDQIAELKINKSDLQEESESVKKPKPKSQELKASTDSLKKEKTRKKSTQDPGNQTVANNQPMCTKPLGDQIAKLKGKKQKPPKTKTTQNSCSQIDRGPIKVPEENEVFEFFIKTVGGPTTLKNKSVMNLFPKDFDISSWFRSHEKRFILFENKERTYQFVIPFYRAATFCLDYNGLRNEKKCEKKDCTHAHICKDFVGGSCSQGQTCQFSHNFFDRANASLISKLELDAFNNDQIRLIYSQRFPHVCSQYSSKNICYKPICGYLHVCKKCLSGECDEGSYCTLSHDLKTDQNTSVLKAYHLESWKESLVKLLVFTHGSSVASTGNKSHKDSSPLGLNESLPDKRKMSQDKLNRVADSKDSLLKEQKGKPHGDDRKIFSRSSTSPSAEKNDGVGENGSFIKEQISSTSMEKGKPSPRKKELLGEMKHGRDKLTETIMQPPASQVANNGSAKPKVRRKKDRTSNVGDKGSTDSVLETDAAETNPICERYLVDKCKTAGCKCHHIDSIKLPYIWQIKMLHSWFTLDKQQIIEVERAYCNRLDNFKAMIFYGDRNYIATLEFNEPDTLTAELVMDGVDTNFTIRTSVRRLSTVSYTKGYKPSAEDSFKTQWRWFYTDDLGNWLLYEPELLQFTLEQKFTRKCQDTFLFCRGNYQFKYRIDFRRMVQINMETGRERKLLRRPLFMSAENVESKLYPTKIVITNGVDVPLPKAWVPWDLAHAFELVELKRKSAEFKKVEQSFFKTLPPQEFNINYICRVQNMELWMSYDGQKKKMKISLERSGQTKEVDERNLFHGTESLNIVQGICTNGFDFRLCGKHGTMYGKGAYFAQNSKYSHCYTNSSSTTAMKYMFMAKVLVGEYTVGSSSYTRPPEKPGGTAHELFDSCVDSVDNLSIFVVFDLKQCYPEYLICYNKIEEFLVEDVASFRSNANVTHQVEQIQLLPMQSSEPTASISSLVDNTFSVLSYPHHISQPIQGSSVTAGNFSDSVSSGAVSYSLPPQSISWLSDSSQTAYPDHGQITHNVEALGNRDSQSVQIGYPSHGQKTHNVEAIGNRASQSVQTTYPGHGQITHNVEAIGNRASPSVQITYPGHGQITHNVEAIGNRASPSVQTAYPGHGQLTHNVEAIGNRASPSVQITYPGHGQITHNVEAIGNRASQSVQTAYPGHGQIKHNVEAIGNRASPSVQITYPGHGQKTHNVEAIGNRASQSVQITYPGHDQITHNVEAIGNRARQSRAAKQEGCCIQ
ncbi:hypothetical protein CHS0354_026069 [Potamilus streckersoni]|uniref:Poly [ADP-ribose] polymerase n=1 Tax=Potamilus streckersoni TaxID=2493646 RepID=A0AAE0SGN2_9BIVA|nr:hypothetical protein CHS0354_026069 [Potamilus streckersoni]